MTLQSIMEWLEFNKINPRCIVYAPGKFVDFSEVYVELQPDGKWKVYSIDYGMEYNVSVHDTEDEACRRFKARILENFTSRTWVD